MQLFLALLASTTTTTKPGTAAAGSSATGLVLILVIGLGAYFLFIRPRSQAQRRQRETMQELGPGDEVMTGAGIFGTVLDVASDRITIETAPGTRITVLRSSVARRITPEADPDETWSSDGGPSDEGDHEAHDEHDAGWASADDADGHNGNQPSAPENQGSDEAEGGTRA
ncbi:MAG TPA: preprotein translocase subunit YajC [Acidimicrobiales bacterium]|nr:preprotein translocase subunit YajC [Acidimicrobiales bacterium]